MKNVQITYLTDIIGSIFNKRLIGKYFSMGNSLKTCQHFRIKFS